MEASEIRALIAKIIVFSITGLFFYLLTPNAGLITYGTLLLGAIGWAVYETAKKEKKPLRIRAVCMGIFLMVFDFIAENLGAFCGLWTSPESFFSVITVPIEIMALTVIGGYAWSMHLPLKANRTFMFFEVLIFGFYGALGEYLLILNGMMIYMNGWTSVHAFVAYTVVWIMLFEIWYKVIKKPKALES